MGWMVLLSNKRFLGAIAVIVIIAVVGHTWYNETNSFDAKVYSVNVQQHIHGNEEGFSTSYSYIVGTSRGMYSISPDGIFATSDFGTLEKDSTYHFFTRGYNIPLIGVYPYIIKARLIKNEQ